MLERGTKVRHCILPGDNTWDIKPERLKEYYTDDGLLDSVRLGRLALEEARITLGEVGYAGQYGQNPVPRGGAMFKVECLKFSSDIPTKWRRGPVRYWDKAATQGGGAFTAGVKGGIDVTDKPWILDVVRAQWDSGRREQQILATAFADGKAVKIGIEQEPGAAGKESAEATARMLSSHGFRVTMDRATGDKETRADPLSTQVNTGNVVIATNPVWNKIYVDEMRFFPMSKYKDQIDASSGMYAMLAKKRIRIGAF
jgi:predicted phage terminase large subunit-like protein